MKKIIYVFVLLVVVVNMSSCWMEVTGRKHKVEIGERRVPKDAPKK